LSEVGASHAFESGRGRKMLKSDPLGKKNLRFFKKIRQACHAMLARACRPR
jgi:hypothetical protein